MSIFYVAYYDLIGHQGAFSKRKSLYQFKNVTHVIAITQLLPLCRDDV